MGGQLYGRCDEEGCRVGLGRRVVVVVAGFPFQRREGDLPPHVVELLGTKLEELQPWGWERFQGEEISTKK